MRNRFTPKPKYFIRKGDCQFPKCDSSMNEPKEKLCRPSLFWLATEAGRAVVESGISLTYRSFRGQKQKGDGHPILVLPGFMATDLSTKTLRRFLNKNGYDAYGWELGRNYAKEEFLEELLHKLELLYQNYGVKVSIIGWSLGGVYARQLAKARPEMVRQIIMMGTPFQAIRESNNVAWIYNLLTGRKKVRKVSQDFLENIPLPAPVPSTAIYTKEDGVVPWKACLEKEEDALHQNIQVRGSHFGLGVNMTVLNIIADRLQYSEKNWEHFKPYNLIHDLLFYPSL